MAETTVNLNAMSLKEIEALVGCKVIDMQVHNKWVVWTLNGQGTTNTIIKVRRK